MKRNTRHTVWNLVDKMCKCEMGPADIVEDMDRTKTYKFAVIMIWANG